MSVPKVKCHACGTEWTGPVVFCGECGAPMTPAPNAQPGDRIARVPPAPQPSSITSTATPAAKQQSRTTKSTPEPKPAEPKAEPKVEARQHDRHSRPTEPELRRTVVGMHAVAPPAASGPAPSRTVVGMPAISASLPPEPARGAPESVKGGKRDSKKSRRGITVPSEPTSTEDTDKLLEALDAGFDTITRPSTPMVPITPSTVPDLPAAVSEAPAAESAEPAPAPAANGAPVIDEETKRAQHESDMAEVRALFTEMAVAHARPLRDFMIEVSWGDPTREWLDVAVPASAGLKRASEALEMPELGASLDGFSAALELAAGEPAIHREVKEMLLGAYNKLVELLPAAFALEGERGRREPIIVRSLLMQVPGVQKVAIDKIYAAGLVSLEMLYAAGPRELSETTGLDPDLAARIHERFQRHRKEAAALDPGKDRAAERSELGALLGDLEKAHDEHELAAKSWSKDAAADRARARKQRNDIMLRMNVLLAHMGEIDRLKALERAPFAQKIKDLRSFLDEAKRKGPRS